MKKALYTVVAVVFGIISFASCKKEYHCHCSYNNQLVRSYDLGNQTADNANKMCSKYDTSSIPGEVLLCTVF